jgi:hypothetical protein
MKPTHQTQGRIGILTAVRVDTSIYCPVGYGAGYVIWNLRIRHRDELAFWRRSVWIRVFTVQWEMVQGIRISNFLTRVLRYVVGIEIRSVGWPHDYSNETVIQMRFGTGNKCSEGDHPISFLLTINPALPDWDQPGLFLWGASDYSPEIWRSLMLRSLVGMYPCLKRTCCLSFQKIELTSQTTEFFKFHSFTLYLFKQ